MAIRFLAALAALLLNFAALRVDASELTPAQEAAAQEIFTSVMSPFCVARSLKDCPSSAAQELKDEIRGKIAVGKTSEEIMNELIIKYGDKIRAVPATEGFGLVGWLAPLGFIALGGIVIFVWFRLRSGQQPAPGPAVSPLDPEMQRRIDEELSKF